MNDKLEEKEGTIRSEMLKILSDGLPHTSKELHGCCGPSCRAVVRVHMVHIRKKLRLKGEDVVCVFRQGRYYYQHVRLLASANDGRH